MPGYGPPRQIAISWSGYSVIRCNPQHMPDSNGIGALPQAILFGIVSGNVFDCITSKQGKYHEHDLH